MPPAARIIGILLGRQRVVLDVRAPATADEAVESVARGNGVTGADQHGREVRPSQAAGLLAHLFEREVDPAVAKAACARRTTSAGAKVPSEAVECAWRSARFTDQSYVGVGVPFERG
jgi:hypothetical protein